MSEFGKIIAPGVIQFKRLLPVSLETAWAYLTEPEKRGKWLATGEMEPRVGGRVDLHFLHASLSPAEEKVPEMHKQYEIGASIFGHITTYSPPRLLAFTWDEGSGEKSEVTFELRQKGDKVQLTVTHRYQGKDRSFMLGFAGGWHTHLGILEDHLNGRVPSGFWSVYTKVEEEYQRIVPG